MNDQSDLNNKIMALLDQAKIPSWETNWQVADALAKIGKPAISFLVQALKNDNGYVRNAVAIALGKIRDSQAIDPLIEAMMYQDDQNYEDDEDAEARLSAIDALGFIGDKRACASLREFLQVCLENDERTLAKYIIDSLGVLGDGDAVPLLIKTLYSVSIYNLDLIKPVQYALIKIGEPSVLALINYLLDQNANWRWVAAEALKKIDNLQAVETFKQVLNDETADEEVKKIARSVLKQ